MKPNHLKIVPVVGIAAVTTVVVILAGKIISLYDLGSSKKAA
jgi:heme A synthase